MEKSLENTGVKMKLKDEELYERLQKKEKDKKIKKYRKERRENK